jgi:threonine dehydratase
VLSGASLSGNPEYSIAGFPETLSVIVSPELLTDITMNLPTLDELEQAARLVYGDMQPSPQLQWPLLSERCGCDVWVKHENHNPTGAFKVRGGLVYLDGLCRREPDTGGIVTATRGNHGQSVAFAAARHGLGTVIVVPRGNNPEKNLAMQALGAELVVHGADFDEAVPYAAELAAERGLHRMPSFHMDLVRGVASYSLELLQNQPDLDRVYVPIGLGSGICGMICARNALGLATEIVGVVSSAADCYARSLAAGECVSTESASTLADGMAVRVPSPDALAIMQGNVSRVVQVDDDEILAAMRYYFTDAHTMAEGAAAAPLAALLKEREFNAGHKVGLVLSGANVDRSLYAKALV